MLPHKHFLIAGLVIVPAAMVLVPEKSAVKVGEWFFIGGLVSAAIDLDVLAVIFLKSGKETRLRPFKSLVAIHRKYKAFMDTMFETGALGIAMKTHLILAGLIILLSYLFLKAYFVPVTLGVVSHIICDTPYLLKTIRKQP